MCNFHQRVSRQDDEELQGALDARIAAVMGVTKYPRRMVIQTTTGWWFGTFFIFPYIGNFIIPTDEVHHFSEGWGKTINQTNMVEKWEYSDEGISWGLYG